MQWLSAEKRSGQTGYTYFLKGEQPGSSQFMTVLCYRGYTIRSRGCEKIEAKQNFTMGTSAQSFGGTIHYATCGREWKDKLTCFRSGLRKVCAGGVEDER